MIFLAYYARPFPSCAGFAAYRSPGPLVHLPLLLACFSTGLFLSGSQPSTAACVIVWTLAGLYFGRDAAIFCHYGPQLTLIAWFVAAVPFIWPEKLRAFGLAHPLTVMAVCITLAAALIAVPVVWARADARL